MTPRGVVGANRHADSELHVGRYVHAIVALASLQRHGPVRQNTTAAADHLQPAVPAVTAWLRPAQRLVCHEPQATRMQVALV